MKTPEETFLAWETAERARLTDAVQAGEPLRFAVGAFKDDEPGPRAIVWNGGCDTVNPRDGMLHAAEVMCAACEADYVIATMDAHGTALRENPVTHEAWKPGEMQNLCNVEGLCETGQLYDVLTILGVRRSDGAVRAKMIPYHPHKVGDEQEILWLTDPDKGMDLDLWTAESEDGSGLGGYVVETLTGAVQGQWLSEMMQERYGQSLADFGFDTADPTKERIRILHQMLGALRFLFAQANEWGAPWLYVPMIAAGSEEEQQIIDESAQRMNADMMVVGGPSPDA
jgi:hypothetical protein